MSESNALRAFFKGFGINAYDEQQALSVNPDADMPYIVYSLSEGSQGEKVSVTADMWYRHKNDGEKTDRVKNSIYETVGTGLVIPFERGAMLIQPDKTFCKAGRDTKNPELRKKSIYLTARFFLKRGADL